MQTEEQQKKEYLELLHKFLKEAEKMFGSKTDYEIRPLQYKESGTPETIYYEADIVNDACAVVWLSSATLTNRKQGIFELSHEVVHLLGPIKQTDGNEVNYLEEGMAVYLSKRITELEIKDYQFCNYAIAKSPQYYHAYMRFMSLLNIDTEAIKKLRQHQPIIGSLTMDDFQQAKLNVPQELIISLLEKFDRSKGPLPTS